MDTFSDISILKINLSKVIYKNIGLAMFIFVGSVINFNQTFIIYHDILPSLGNRIYLLCITLVILYLSAILLNVYCLIPRFLLRGRYTDYSILVLLTVFMLPNIMIIQEYAVRTYYGLPHRISNYLNPLILVDNMATCMIVLVCFIGIAAPIFISKWLEQREMLRRLETEHIKAEINKLKGQISPDYLSLVLNKAADTVHADHKLASEMLFCLSNILRYQLYEADKERVLLVSEVNFIRSLFELSQLCYNDFSYTIKTHGDMTKISVAPLLFGAVSQLFITNNARIVLSLMYADDNVRLRITGDDLCKVSDSKIIELKKQLDYMYPECWEGEFNTGEAYINIKP